MTDHLDGIDDLVVRLHYVGGPGPWRSTPVEQHIALHLSGTGHDHLAPAGTLAADVAELLAPIRRGLERLCAWLAEALR